MSFRSQLRPWHLVVAAALAVAVCLSLLRGSTRHSAGDPEGSAPSSHHAADLGPANVPLPRGGWEATGKVVWVAPNVHANQPPGTVLRRPWEFQKVCWGPCKVEFSRWTLYGPSQTLLVRHGHFFTAKFPPVRVPCAYPRGSSYPRHSYGQSHDSYKLWWSNDHNHIHAIEHRTETGCYRTPDPPDVTRWHATHTARKPHTNGIPS